MASDGIAGSDIWNQYIKFIVLSNIPQNFKCKLISLIPSIFIIPESIDYSWHEDNLKEKIKELKTMPACTTKSKIEDNDAVVLIKLMKSICQEYYPSLSNHRFLSSEIIVPSTLSSFLESLNAVIFSKRVINADSIASLLSIDDTVVLVSKQILKNAKLEQIANSVPEEARSYIRRITLDISVSSILGILNELKIDVQDITALKKQIYEQIMAFCTLSGYLIIDNNDQIAFTDYLDNFQANIDYYNASLEGVQARIKCSEENRQLVLNKLKEMIENHPYIKFLIDTSRSFDLSGLVDAVAIDIGDDESTIRDKIDKTKAFENAVKSDERFDKPMKCQFVISQGRPNQKEINKYIQIENYLLNCFHLDKESYSSPSGYIYECPNPKIEIAIPSNKLLSFICIYCHEREMANRLKEQHSKQNL